MKFVIFADREGSNTVYWYGKGWTTNINNAITFSEEPKEKLKNIIDNPILQPQLYKIKKIEYKEI